MLYAHVLGLCWGCVGAVLCSLCSCVKAVLGLCAHVLGLCCACHLLDSLSSTVVQQTHFVFSSRNASLVTEVIVFVQRKKQMIRQ